MSPPSTADCTSTASERVQELLSARFFAVSLTSSSNGGQIKEFCFMIVYERWKVWLRVFLLSYLGWLIRMCFLAVWWEKRKNTKTLRPNVNKFLPNEQMDDIWLWWVLNIFCCSPNMWTGNFSCSESRIFAVLTYDLIDGCNFCFKWTMFLFWITTL